MFARTSNPWGKDGLGKYKALRVRGPRSETVDISDLRNVGGQGLGGLGGLALRLGGVPFIYCLRHPGMDENV